MNARPPRSGPSWARGRRGWAWLLSCAAALAALLSAPVVCWSNPPVVERDEADLLLLEVRYGSATLSDGVPAWPCGEGCALVPLGEVTRLLELPIRVEPEAGQAGGWFLDPSRAFALDVAAGQVRVNGRTLPFKAEQIEVHADDIYVHPALLAAWFPLRLEVLPERMLLRVEATEPLPRDLRRAMQEREAQLQGGEGAGGEGLQLRRVESPAALVGLPALDSELTLSGRRDDAGAVYNARQTALARGDLLYGSGEVYLRASASEERQDVDARLGVEYVDAEGGLLGSLEATRARVGHTTADAVPLTARATPALGVSVSNAPLTAPTSFSSTDLSGTHLPGWTAELYHNGDLIAAQEVDGAGRWLFEDVPLRYGTNTFTVALYGPFGERVERVSVISVGADMLPPGALRYRLGAWRLEERPGDPLTCCGPVEEHERLRADASLQLGLTERVSATALVLTQPRFDGRRTFVQPGLKASVLGGVGQALAVYDVDAGGWGGRLGFSRVLWGLNLQVEQDWLLELESGARLGSNGVAERGVRTRAGLSGRAQLPGLRASGYHLQIEDTRLRSSTLTEVSARFVQLGFNLNTTLETTARLRPEGQDDEVFQTLQLQWRDAGLQARAGAHVPIWPEMRALPLDTSARLQLTPDLWLSAEGHLEVAAPLHGGAGLGLQLDLGVAFFGASFNWRDDRVEARLTLSTSALPGDAEAPLTLASTPGAQQGTVEARVFLDADRDGRFDLDEQVLSGVVVRADRAPTPATDARGLTRCRVEAWRPVALTLDPRTLEDPSWVPAEPAVEVVARPGTRTEVEIPVLVVGEIDGTVFLDSPGRAPRPIGAVDLLLIDARGAIAQQTRSAWDGFYLFERVPPGRYTVQPAPDLLAQHDVRSAAPLTLDLAAGEIASGRDVMLERTGELSSAPQDDAPRSQLQPVGRSKGDQGAGVDRPHPRDREGRWRGRSGLFGLEMETPDPS